MNSLEFINDEIEATKRSYKAFELDYELFHRESDNRDAENLMKKLIQLQQIKTELEAWEVVKPYVDIIDKYTPYPTWQLKPNYDKCKLNETNILIKALEVEDEKVVSN